MRTTLWLCWVPVLGACSLDLDGAPPPSTAAAHDDDDCDEPPAESCDEVAFGDLPTSAAGEACCTEGFNHACPDAGFGRLCAPLDQDEAWCEQWQCSGGTSCDWVEVASVDRDADRCTYAPVPSGAPLAPVGAAEDGTCCSEAFDDACPTLGAGRQCRDSWTAVVYCEQWQCGPTGCAWAYGEPVRFE